MDTYSALTGGSSELCLDSSSDIPHIPNGVSDPPSLSYFPAGSYWSPIGTRSGAANADFYFFSFFIFFAPFFIDFLFRVSAIRLTVKPAAD
ncbi:uncharacterized protein ASPGLDRAFT_45572 [Aspergillus glaucus CBS 516.65]|uniref:Uncharacterized protein n=1 Tax=Aspergillus glaucus CBS 516.65 TaxID=1160497 RepID=A0A1L9VNX3_ASPGL|nr:hypothetical protein ASPGLDRAFT_45572 [Aspergillus glaucus CBS 516.65]OJJ85580.1 hypothetical protein ASPGLDRAFT_45572 [Aspergillus glaucus CBS 516.65]